MPRYEGRRELPGNSNHLRPLADEDGRYELVPTPDYRVAEARLLHDVATIVQ